MSIITDRQDKATHRYVADSAKVLTANKNDKKNVTPSDYAPSDEARQCRTEILDDFRLGWQTMHLPRPRQLGLGQARLQPGGAQHGLEGLLGRRIQGFSHRSRSLPG